MMLAVLTAVMKMIKQTEMSKTTKRRIAAVLFCLIDTTQDCFTSNEC